MRKSILSTLLAGGFAVAAGAAMAGDLKPLSDAQMDGVSAGYIVQMIGGAGGTGDWINATTGSQVAAVTGNSASGAGTFTNLSVSLLAPAISASGQTILVSN